MSILRTLAAIVIAIALGALVWTTARGVARELSGTWDEGVYLFLARELALTHSRAQLADLGVAPLPVTLAWSGAIAPAEAPPHDATVYVQRLDRARIRAVLWFGIPLVIGVFAAVAASRGLAIGAVAATLLACSPNIAAHYSLATTDAAFVVTCLAVVIALIAYLRDQTFGRAATLMLALGLALSVKYSALGLFAAAVVLFAAHWRRRRIMIDGLVLVGGLIVAWAFHAFATAPLVVADGTATHAVAALFRWTGHGDRAASMVAGLSAPIFVHGIAAQMFLDRAGQEAFLLGQTAQYGWWYYFPVAILLKSTPVELFAFAAFVALACVRRLRDLESRVIITVVAVFGAATLASHRDLGVRYALPLITLGLIAGVVWVSDQLRGRPRAAAAVAVVALLGQFVSYRSIGVDYLAYFNGMSGGPAEGYTKLVDSNLDWGQDLTRLRARLDAHGADRVALAYFGSAPMAAYGIPSRPVRSLAGPDAPRWLAVSATVLQGVFMCGDPYAPLRSVAADDRAGYSMFLFDANRAEVHRALEAVLRDPCLP